VTVVVTGLGAVSPIGVGVEDFWQAALAGTVGTHEMTRFDAQGLMSRQAGEVTDLDTAPYIRRLDPAELAHSTRFAVAAARMAVEDAAVEVEGSDRAGVCFGIVMGNRPALDAWARRFVDSDGRAAPDGAARHSHDATQLVRAPAAELGLRGPSTVIPTACAAGNSAIAYACDLIEAGRADVMVAGGADELSFAMCLMFNSMKSLSPDVVRPFDAKRRGLIVGEGAGALVLESVAHQRARGATVYGVVAGHGNFSDAHHMTAPHPEGMGAVRSMKAALDMARRSPAEVDFVSAHGTGTPANDLVEARAIHALLGNVPVSSTKSVLGHTQGAASALEAVVCLLAMRDGVIPPTANLTELDPECEIDVVAHRSREATVDVALNNAFGFGGNICCVVFAREAAS
jgi:3-oxoacyl-(acyl-carrier-protein) synthase